MAIGLKKVWPKVRLFVFRPVVGVTRLSPVLNPFFGYTFQLELFNRGFGVVRCHIWLDSVSDSHGCKRWEIPSPVEIAHSDNRGPVLDGEKPESWELLIVEPGGLTTAPSLFVNTMQNGKILIGKSPPLDHQEELLFRFRITFNPPKDEGTCLADRTVLCSVKPCPELPEEYRMLIIKQGTLGQCQRELTKYTSEKK